MYRDDFIHALLVWAANRWQHRARTSAPLDDHACVACDSKNLRLEAPGVYTCLDCGYEGGSRRAAWVREKQKKEVELFTREQRQARATALLREAHRLLRDADDGYARVGAAIRYEDTGGFTPSGNAAADAFSGLVQAEQLIERAVDFDPSLKPPHLDEVALGSQAFMAAQAGEHLAQLLGWLAREPRAKLGSPGD